MWPFKRWKVPDFNDVVQGYPDVPCGNKEVHYYWTDIEGFTCPKCCAIEDRLKEEQRDERLAEMIAIKVVEKLKGGAA